MVYHGTVKNGVIVLDGASPLADGTLVRIEPVAMPSASAAALLRAAGIWSAAAADVDKSLEDLRLMKQQEVEAGESGVGRNGPE